MRFACVGAVAQNVACAGGCQSTKLETIQGWPTLGSKSRAPFKSCAAHRKSLKTSKGKRAAEPASNCNPDTASIGIVPPCQGEISTTSFYGRDVPTTAQRFQPARKAKLMCIPIVDSDIEQQLVAHGSSSSNSSDSSGSNSSGGSNSSDGSSEGPSGANSDNGGQDVSGASTISATNSDSSTSSGSNTEPYSEARSTTVYLYILERR